MKKDQVKLPFTILVDGREKTPYTFQGLRSDKRHGGGPLEVSWEWANLKTGDYSVAGYESRVAIERKSLEDLYSTLGSNRERFQRELERLAEMDFAAIVIEATWRRILFHPPTRSNLNPKTVWRTCLAWMVRYKVPWLTLENRRLSEVATLRLLEKWWRNR